jgi:hypothetical protein
MSTGWAGKPMMFSLYLAFRMALPTPATVAFGRDIGYIQWFGQIGEWELIFQQANDRA